MEREPTAAWRAHDPAVTWSAVWAGAFAALATSMVLTLAGAGIGYSLSPTLASRASLAGFSPTVGAGLIVVQVLSAALGGYLAGRLRTPWHTVHGDESHFRDTAHGLIVWAVATVGGVIMAAVVIGPYAEAMHPATAVVVVDPVQAANIAAQSALFTAVGLLVSAFVAAVAARLGGMETEAAHAKAHPLV